MSGLASYVSGKSLEVAESDVICSSFKSRCFHNSYNARRQCTIKRQFIEASVDMCVRQLEEDQIREEAKMKAKEQAAARAVRFYLFIYFSA